ncbi:hypothetical protein [Pontixanthobacter sp.]|uniref:hypothetical protein n=1 Tax=Pontixanthobacter sp. TaxID=2792078 RepID=UPI003C7D3DE0
MRQIAEPFFKLDNRLAQFVSQSKEQILTQMRIAWWRDQLGKPVGERPEGDPVLDALSAHWQGEEAALIALVDGWEGLLAEPPLPQDAARDFAEGRSECFAAIARLSGAAEFAHCARNAGIRWAYADLVSRMSNIQEASFVLSNASIPDHYEDQLPYKLRALLILSRLADKALSKTGGPLIEGRSDIIAVMRVGLLGR